MPRDDRARVGDAPEVSLERLELIAALSREGCPLCSVAHQAARRYLRSLLHEYVLDVGVRLKLHHSRGFCQEHAWQLQQLEIELWHDNMGTATLYEDLAGTIAGIIRDHAHAGPAPTGRFRRGRPAVARALDPTGRCPACEAAGFGVGYLGRILLRGLDHDREIREKFREGFGLCLTHFRSLLELASSKAAWELLVEVEALRFQALAAELREYTRKLTWGHQHEPVGVEQGSPVRVIEQFVGRGR